MVQSDPEFPRVYIESKGSALAGIVQRGRDCFNNGGNLALAGLCGKGELFRTTYEEPIKTIAEPIGLRDPRERAL